MGNGNSIQTKTGKRRGKDYQSTDGSTAGNSKRAVNGTVIPGGGTPVASNEHPKTLGKVPRATNPFIIFFLRLRSKKPNEHVTVIARAAGKLWARMSTDERKKYIDLANAEKKRREEKKRRRKNH